MAPLASATGGSSTAPQAFSRSRQHRARGRTAPSPSDRLRALGDSVTAGFGYYSPLLSEMLFGADNMGCAVYADVFGGYRECVEEAFAEVHLQAALKSLYTDLAQHTSATIFLMQHHLSVPSTALAYSATQIAEMGNEVDGPSVQSTPAQDELEILHPLSFCEGPAGGSPPWVISGDTGIHPSATGYAQMASQVPAPTGG